MKILCPLRRLSGDGMGNAYYKDIFRSIKKNWKRFVSIMVITALGVAMLTGLYAACLDMYRSADQFYDDRHLFDIRIVSTLGLTQEDVECLSQMNGIETAEGSYSEVVYTEVAGTRKSAEMTVLSPMGLNLPYLLAGSFPSKSGELAVTQKYLDESGQSVGDVLIIEEATEDDNNESSSSPIETVIKDEDGSLDVEIDFDINAELEKEAQSPAFLNTTYVITGVVLDPMDIQSSQGSASAFRFTSTSDYTFFITEQDVQSDIFTAVHIVVSGAKEMDSFSDAYEEAVVNVTETIENHIKEQREQARYDSIFLEAQTKIEEAEATMHEEFAKADKQFQDAWEEIEEARQELADGEATLIKEEQDAERKIANARAELKRARQKISDAEKQLAEGEMQLTNGKAELEKNAEAVTQGKQQLADEQKRAEASLTAAEEQLIQEQNQLDEARTQLETEIEEMRFLLGEEWPENEWNALVASSAALAAIGADDETIAIETAEESASLANALSAIGMSNDSDIAIDSAEGTASPNDLSRGAIQAALGMGKIQGGQHMLDQHKESFDVQKQETLQQLTKAEAELDAAETQINEAHNMLETQRVELDNAKAELSSGKAELAKGEKRLQTEESKANQEIAKAWQEIFDGQKELTEGEATFVEQKQEYLEVKEEAQQKLKEAYAELNDLIKAQWYVQDRTSLDSYSSLDSDLSSIEAIGNVFPLIFLPVAILMSLTTMTRMVEEERVLIGTYKALGFGNAAIYQKYLFFAFMACLLGGIAGDLLGFIFMPNFVSTILSELYTLPKFYLSFDPLYGVGGILLFMIGIVGATALACRSGLSQMPAALMRPKSPRAGFRIWLERIPFIWNRFNFLAKVTVRNLFRYKKRLFMTVGGIMGCTALILCGLAIKDSVEGLAPKQYDVIYQYDLMLVFKDKDNDLLVEQLAADKAIDSYLNLRVESIKLLNADGESEKAQLMIFPDSTAVSEYIRLETPKGMSVPLDDSGIIITQNAAQMLHLVEGDVVTLQDDDLVQNEAVLSQIVKNYLGNNIYITQQLYESLFDEYVPNSMLARLSEDNVDHVAYAEELLGNDSVLSAASTIGLKEKFRFDLIHAIVLLLIAMAGGLAFVVLFTLSNTNISERVRELATIKVLGFYDNEVHQYVNRETIILSTIGILLGLPAGRLISEYLTIALNMPSIHFAVEIKPISYVISAAVTFVFAIIVSFITNRTLNRINMVEALKSVE